MPSLRKRVWPSGKITWDIRYWHNQRRMVFTIGETDRRTAEKIFHRFCNSYVEGEINNHNDHDVVPLQEKHKLSELAVQAKVFAASNKSVKTLDREQRAFMQIIKIFGDIPIQELSYAKIEEYKAKRLLAVKPATINIEIRVLNTALNQAVAIGWLLESPKLLFKQIKISETDPPNWLSDEEVAMIITTHDAEFRNFLLFLLNTGCRRNEALGITWEDVDLEKKQIVIRGEIGKMGKRRTIPINQSLALILHNWTIEKKGHLFPNFEPNQVSMKFRRWARQIGLKKGISLHSLRSTFACHLIKQGVDIYTVSRLLGHSSVKVTEKHYVTLDSEHALSAVDKLKFASHDETT